MAEEKNKQVLELPITRGRLTRNQLIDLEGYGINAGKGLSTVDFCIAQIEFLKSKGVPEHSEIITGYKLEMAKAAMYETQS